ncbi:MAG: hypothetical protein R3F44_12135 [Candidatus Competibacteraceae bacterium]
MDSPLLVKQEDGEVYDWLLVDADLAQYQDADPASDKVAAKNLDLANLRRNLYRLIKNYRIDLSGFFQPPPPITLENAVTVDGSVSPVLMRNLDEYRFTPAFPALKVCISNGKRGPGDADLQLAYWSYASNGWVFHANRATPGTSDESITITDHNLLNREWRILVKYSAGSSVPYRLRAFAVYDLRALHNLLHPSHTGTPPPGPIVNAPWQNAQPGGWQFYALTYWRMPLPCSSKSNAPTDPATSRAKRRATLVQQCAVPNPKQRHHPYAIHRCDQQSTTDRRSVVRWHPGAGASRRRLQPDRHPVPSDWSASRRDIPLANGVPATGSVWFGDWRYYLLTLPMNATHMEYTPSVMDPAMVTSIDGAQRPTAESHQ